MDRVVDICKVRVRADGLIRGELRLTHNKKDQIGSAQVRFSSQLPYGAAFPPVSLWRDR